jgi:anti-sigma factor RsiW
MMATSRKIPEDEPGEIEALLPWYAAGTLDAREARRVEAALADDPRLVRQYAAIQDEYAETIHLNESLGAPSSDAMQKLFAAIDAEPARAYSNSPRLSTRISGFFASLSPRTLAWSASLGALALLLQAGVITGVLLNDSKTGYQTASAPSSLPATTGSYAMIRFAPQATATDNTQFLDANKLSVAGGPAAGGMYRVRVAVTGIPKAELEKIVKQLQQDKAVEFVAPVE